jgi:hypothetical protein
MLDEAFAFHHEGKLLVKVEKDELEFKVAVLPNDALITDELHIKYKSAT